MRRGFKAEADRIALRVRREALGADGVDPIDAWELARALGLVVLSLRELEGLPPETLAHFEKLAREDFSGVTVMAGEARAVVLNSGHSRERQANTLAHEVSHFVLRHPLHPAFDGTGCRNCNPEQEDEASWLGMALLVPKEAALHALRTGLELRAAARRYGVSVELMRMRLNVCRAWAERAGASLAPFAPRAARARG